MLKNPFNKIILSSYFFIFQDHLEEIFSGVLVTYDHVLTAGHKASELNQVKKDSCDGSTLIAYDAWVATELHKSEKRQFRVIYVIPHKKKIKLGDPHNIALLTVSYKSELQFSFLYGSKNSILVKNCGS